VPCGIGDRAVTSLELESREPDLTLETAAARVARQFGQVFRAQMLWLESLEDLAPRGENAHVEA
jgi:lipoyl(octanoyl) transferase